MTRLMRLLEVAAFISLVALAIGIRSIGVPPALLWLDEAWRVRQGLEGGDYGVLLLSEKLFVWIGFLIAGVNAAAFRVWPILGLLLSMEALRRLRATLFRTPLWLWTCLTYAMASKFVMHTREFKPYGVDLGLTLASITAAVSAANGPTRSLNWCMVVSCLTAASTAIFPFVHAGTSLFLLTRRSFSSVELLKAVVVPPVIFGFVYFGFLAEQAGVESTTKYWSALYLTDLQSLRHIADMAWATGQSYDLLGPAVLWTSTFLLAPLVSLIRRDGFWALLLGPFLAQAAFSAAGKYPLFDRPSFYFYGIAALATPYVLDTALLVIRQDGVRRLAAWVVMLAGVTWLTLSGQAETQWANGVRWPLRPDSRVVFEQLAREYKGGDPLFLNDGIAHTFALYAPSYFPPGSPLGSYRADWSTALRNRSLTELCFHLMLRAESMETGQTIWFASAHTGYAARYYNELLRRVGEVDLLVDERAACLVRVRLTSPMRELRPLCDQLWKQSFPEKK